MKIRNLVLFLGAFLFLSCNESSRVNPVQEIIATETTFTKTVI